LCETGNVIRTANQLHNSLYLLPLKNTFRYFFVFSTVFPTNLLRCLERRFLVPLPLRRE